MSDDRVHDPKYCSLCASLRHPARGADAKRLQEHLSRSPLPRQKAA